MNQGSASPANGPADLSALVREPQQERSRRTLARLVDAAHELLDAEGPDALTVTRIARRARTSVGSFYARFDGKEELIRYLGETTLARAMAEWQDALDQAPAGGRANGEAEADSTALSALAAALLAAFTEGAASRLRALDGVEDPAPARLARFEDRVREDLEALMARLGAGDFQRAIGAGMTLASIEAMSRSGPFAGSPAHEVARAVTLYLSLPESETEEEWAPDKAAQLEPEPAAAPEPAATSEPAVTLETSAGSEPATAPEPASTSEPDATSEATTAPERADDDEREDDEEEPSAPASEVDLFDVWN